MMMVMYMKVILKMIVLKAKELIIGAMALLFILVNGRVVLRMELVSTNKKATSSLVAIKMIKKMVMVLKNIQTTVNMKVILKMIKNAAKAYTHSKTKTSIQATTSMAKKKAKDNINILMVKCILGSGWIIGNMVKGFGLIKMAKSKMAVGNLVKG